MHSYSKQYWALFWILSLIIVVVLGVRVWHIRLLYLDATIRTHTSRVLRDVAEEEGWLVSDITIINVKTDTLRIEHRLHQRGISQPECFLISFDTSTLQSCTDS